MLQQPLAPFGGAAGTAYPGLLLLIFTNSAYQPLVAITQQVKLCGVRSKLRSFAASGQSCTNLLQHEMSACRYTMLLQSVCNSVRPAVHPIPNLCLRFIGALGFQPGTKDMCFPYQEMHLFRATTSRVTMAHSAQSPAWRGSECVSAVTELTSPQTSS